MQDEVERKGAGFYGPLAKAVGVSKDSLDGLILTLNAYKTGLDAKDADQVPSVAQTSSDKSNEPDIGKSIR